MYQKQRSAIQYIPGSEASPIIQIPGTLATAFFLVCLFFFVGFFFGFFWAFFFLDNKVGGSILCTITERGWADHHVVPPPN